MIVSPLFQLLLDVLAESEMDFKVAAEHETIRMAIEGDDGRWVAYARVLPSRKVVVYSVADIHVPEGRRPAMAELLTRANFGIVVGNFEMDYEDGEVRFKTSLDSGGEVFPAAIFQHLLDANLAHMNKYLPGIMGVGFGDLAPAEAVRRCEAATPDEDSPSE
jgi:hypothetical protein